MFVVTCAHPRDSRPRLIKAENREEAKKWEAMCDHRRDELLKIMIKDSEDWIAEDQIEEVK